MSVKSTKLSIKSRSYADDKKTVTDNINYVNPTISNGTAIELAQHINALTKNSYQSTEKIDTTELDTLTPQRSIVIAATHWESAQNANVVTGIGTANELTAKVTSADSAFNIAVRLTDMLLTGNYAPYWRDVTCSDDTVKVGFPRLSYYTEDYATAGLHKNWGMDLEVKPTKPCTITGTICIPPSDDYDGYERTLTYTLEERT